MSLRSWQTIAITGTIPTPATVAATDTFTPNERGFWEVINSSGGPVTVTVIVPGTTFGQNNPDVAVTVADGATKKIGPLVPALQDNSTGLISITHSATTGVTGAACSI